MKRINQVLKFIATFGFSGYLPQAPGTWATALAIVLWLILPLESKIVQFGLLAPTLLIGIAAARQMEVESGTKDPSIVVIDEVCGVWLALWILPNYHIPEQIGSIVAVFILFRIFDIIKPPPVRQLERLPGGLGIIADDLAAGIYTAASIYFWNWLW